MVDGNASRSGQSGSSRRLSQRVHFPIQPSQIGVSRQAVLPLGPASGASAPGPLCRPDLTTCRRWWRQVNNHKVHTPHTSVLDWTEKPAPVRIALVGTPGKVGTRVPTQIHI